MGGRLGDIKLHPIVLLVDSFISDQFPVNGLCFTGDSECYSLHYWQNIRGTEMLLKKFTVLEGRMCL